MGDTRLNPNLPVFGEHWLWFFVWGLLLVILGIVALTYTTITTLLSVIVLGFIIFASGIVVIMDSFTFWRGKSRAFFLHFLMGVLYVLVGLFLMATPVWASMSLTLLLGVFYVVVGCSRLFTTFSKRTLYRGWGFFNGFVALLLGILILMQWPASGLFMIGIFIGIDLIFLGVAYLATAMTGRRHIRTTL